MSKEKEESGNLKLGIKDFGPISSGSVAIKPLTLLIGPNSSGKTYFAMLVRTLFEVLASKKTKTMPFISHYRKKNPIYKKLWAEISEIGIRINDLKEGDEFEIPIESVKEFSTFFFKETFERLLNNELSRSFSCRIEELIRNNKKAFYLDIGFEFLPIQYNFRKTKLKKRPGDDFKIKLSIGILDSNEKSFSVQYDDLLNEYFVLISKEKLENESNLGDLAFKVLGAIFLGWHYRLEQLLLPCYYLPAARSGILQEHKSLVSNIVQYASYPEFVEIENLKVSGVVSDFIASLIEFPKEGGPFFNFARQLENELINGEVAVTSTDEFMYPELTYRFRNKEIPIQRSSSTVSELAALLLYLKYKVQPGSLLIIEEPEAHLHPENQRILAKFLVRLIRNGVRLFITTHSDYLLDQLSSFIMLSRLKDEKQRKKLNYEKDDYLKPDEIGVYVFNFDNKSDGFKIEEVEISEEDGISQDEFLKVNEALYEESILIQENLQAKK